MFSFYFSYFYQKSIRITYKIDGKMEICLHLSDDKKVSESFAQTPAQKFYLMHRGIKRLSWAPLQ